MIKAEFIRPKFRQWADFATDLGFTDFITPEDGFGTELLEHVPPKCEAVWRQGYAPTY